MATNIKDLMYAEHRASILRDFQTLFNIEINEELFAPLGGGDEESCDRIIIFEGELPFFRANRLSFAFQCFSKSAPEEPFLFMHAGSCGNFNLQRKGSKALLDGIVMSAPRNRTQSEVDEVLSRAYIWLEENIPK